VSAWSRPARGGRCSSALLGLFTYLLTLAAPVSAQDAPVEPTDSAATTEDAAAVDPIAGLPLFLTVGAGVGRRLDDCVLCPLPLKTQSFTGHVSLGKYLVDKLAIGVDASVWRKGQPGEPVAADSTATVFPTTLVTQLGNANLVLSYQRWHVFVRGGVGVAFGSVSIQDAQANLATASGIGVGYTLGGGATLPIAGMVSLAFFANWNSGSYDLAVPTAILEEGVRHDFVEVGVGITLR